MKKTFTLTEGFGHGFATCQMARSLNAEIVILPAKDTKEEFEAESDKIYNNLVFFFPEIKRVAFEERENYADAFDFRAELIAGNIPAEWWLGFAKVESTVGDTSELPQFAGLQGETNVLFVPQKLQSDGMCGVSAAQQSLTPAVFNFLKLEPVNLVLGQHFNKVADLDKVKALADEFSLYVPGMTEDGEVFGIRGVQHKMYENLYKQLKLSVGIAGTHTWQMLTQHPEVPQIILYNHKGVEDWDKISAAYRAAGYEIYALGFDETTDFNRLSAEIEKLYIDLI